MRVKYKDFSEFSGVADIRKPTSFILCWWFGFLFFWLMQDVILGCGTRWCLTKQTKQEWGEKLESQTESY